jgi:hypothetical protein
MNVRAAEAVRNRSDVSRFLVHLTRNNKAEYPRTGGTARETFEAIMREKKIRAKGIHCLHGRQLKLQPLEISRQCRVVCLTETPLDEIKHLTEVYRAIDLENYGFVFPKSFLLAKDAQPAIYVNGYCLGSAQRKRFDKILQVAIDGKFKGTIWRTLPFVNVMHDGHDFAWEREWRVGATIDFRLSDLVCVILPEDEEDLREQMTKNGIAAIDPNWSHERMVEELSRQQRRTRQIWLPKVMKVKPKLKLRRA